MFNKQLSASQALFDEACRFWLQYLQPVTTPLALISQIQRSGGSMLNQLFDGHPEVHSHPHELKFGYPRKFDWPPIDLADPPERWFEILFEDIVVRHFKYGYKKMAKYEETFLFIFLPSMQKEIFLNYVDAVTDIAGRDVFDAYMTSYFGAWLNNQNRRGTKKFVTAFTPRLAFSAANMDSFFEIYPEGRLISVVRDPKNWFPSANRHELDKYGDIRKALDQWNESTRSMVRNKKAYGDRVCLLTFEDLIQRTESVMRHLADFLDIAYNDILLTPTFNKTLVKPNTSFKIENPGIMVSALTRYRTLRREELNTIEDMTGDIYSRALGLVESFS